MNLKYPKELTEYLDTFVVGQEKAKQDVATSIFLHLAKTYMGTCTGRLINKSNLLIAGPSGCGKTYIVDLLCKHLDLPYLRIDATNISQEGWQGRSMSSYIDEYLEENWELYKTKKGQTKLQSGIFFIDEFDKLGQSNIGSGGTDYNKRVQESLLRVVEGQGVSTSRYYLDTSNILFIFAGSFQTLRDNRKKRSNPLGFHSKDIKEMPIHKELCQSGIIPELAGRISCITEVYPLKEKDMLDLLYNKENSILEQYRDLEYFLEEDFKLTKYRLQKIAKRSVENGTGVRGVQVELDRHVRKVCRNLEGWEFEIDVGDEES